ncbi:ExbD/TolR family protein [Sphingomonas sp. GCM10030256]|uniref:ExbD/TolR family protein n=1 Tax=Sphingomonas sp. GCM10030256 TaxID=3273427 RepID=UPI00360E5D40
MTRSSDATPMVEMNTTPLIDVMLVLLVMLIITIPLQSHAVKLDLPNGSPPEIGVRATKNKLVVSNAGQLFWNGAAVDRAQLRQLLDTSAQMTPTPELHLQPDALAPYAVLDEVLAITKRAQVTKVGFVGNEAYARF